MPKASFSKPMSSGDSTLMMLLSLNLLLLVFFMLLNSMAITHGKKHNENGVKKPREGFSVSDPGGAPGVSGGSMPEVPLANWRAGIVNRMQGMTANRIELRVAPQQGNANKVDVSMPLSTVFNDEGRVVRGEFLRNMAAAAGGESHLVWQVRGQNAAKLAAYAAALATETGEAEVMIADEDELHVMVTPGATTKPGMGLQVQQVGEAAGGKVMGVEEKETPRE